MITMLVLQFWLANSPLIVKVQIEYPTPHLCSIALDAKKWPIPVDKTTGKPIDWAFLTASCEVTQ